MDKGKYTQDELLKKVTELEAKLAQSQWMYNKDIILDNDEPLPFYGDVTELNTDRTILDTVGKENIKALTSELMDLLDSSLAVYEKNGDYAYGVFNSGWCRLLDASSRKLCNTNDNKTALNCDKWLCHDHCWKVSEQAIANKKSTNIDCAGGIHIHAEPIFVGKEVIGVINCGYGNPPRDDKTIKEISERYNIDFKTLKQKAEEYEPRPDLVVEIAKKRLKSIAKLLGEIVLRKKAEQALKAKNEEYEAINEELYKAKQQAEASEEKFSTIFNMSQSLICIADINNATFKFVNPTFKKILGYSEKELLNKPFLKFIHPEDIEPTKEIIEKELQTGKTVISFENRYRCKNGRYCWLSWNSFPVPEKGITYAIAHDVTELKQHIATVEQNNNRLEILKDLYEMSNIDINDVYDFTLEKAIELCNSKIGFLGFVNDDETLVKMHAWSASVMKTCEVKDEYLDFDVSKAGIWAEAIRQRKPFIINNFKTENPLKKGTPKGHVEITNYLSIPVFDNEKIVAIIAVGNKESNYTYTDVNELTLLLNGMWNIVKHKLNEVEILENKKEFQTWIQNTPVCTKKIDLNFNLQFMSEAGIRELKVDDVNALYGAPYPFNFFPETFQKAMADTMKRVKQTGKIIQIDGILSDTKGKEMWYNHILVPVNNKEGKLDYILIISTDISERKWSEEKLIKEKENAEIQNNQIKHLYKAAKAILEYDDFTTTAKRLFESCKQLTGATSGYVALLNEKGEENEVLFLDSGGLPCSVDESLPMPIRGLRGIAYDKSKAVYHNDFMNSEHIIFMPQGHVTLKNVLFAPLIISKKPVGLIGLANKPTDFNDNDLEISATFGELASISLKNSRNYEELIDAKEKAEESDYLKTAFLQNLSHEIRTPLNAICGFSSSLNKPNLTEDRRKSFASIILTSSNQLLSIMNDILTISSLETKQEKVKIEEVCVNNIIVDMLSKYKQQSLNQNISLYAKKPLNDKQSEIYTDKTKIAQILNSLISNALKFTHEGFVEIGYEIVEINDYAFQLQFYVKDSGIGIRTEQQEEIFDRFRQADLSTTKKYGGTGLGLAISKAFVELLGGKIWVDSELDKGSVFYVALPYKPVNEINFSTTLKQDIGHPTILVAEDEEFNFLYIEELLTELNYKLIHAKSGQEAVDMVKSNPNISLILMDIKMPIMD